ncbi:hypothetical protein LJD22_10655 [Bacillus velezensis]|nr:hypothetical protein [Bacillus velezensis]
MRLYHKNAFKLLCVEAVYIDILHDPAEMINSFFKKNRRYQPAASNYERCCSIAFFVICE